MTTNAGQPRLVTPTDDIKIDKIHYVHACTVGDIALRRATGEVVIIPSAIVAKFTVPIPVGVMDEVLATGTTATGIIVW